MILRTAWLILQKYLQMVKHQEIPRNSLNYPHHADYKLLLSKSDFEIFTDIVLPILQLLLQQLRSTYIVWL